MSDQGDLNRLARALDEGEWREAGGVARELASRCDRHGVLTLRPLEVWSLLTAIADLVDELDEAGVERIDDDEEGDDEE